MSLNQDELKAHLAKLISEPPRKLVFLARSFGRHALELGNPIPERPLYFLKSPTALISPPAPVVIPTESIEVHYEAEVAVILSASLSQATPDEAERAIGGWTVLNDITARDAQREDQGRFTRAKGYDTFCPISPEVIVSLDWRRAHIQGWLNGQRVQSAPLTDMLFSPGEALSAISNVMTLNPGDLVSLGTPAGVGALTSGDRFEVRLCLETGVSEVFETALSLTHEVIQAPNLKR